jgi:hypothetical protein
MFDVKILTFYHDNVTMFHFVVLTYFHFFHEKFRTPLLCKMDRLIGRIHDTQQ